MARIGITGHVVLASGTAELVYARLIEELRLYTGQKLHGVTCLADGADQLFAQAILALAGTYEVILPAINYRQETVEQRNSATFDNLLRRAATVTYMPFQRPTRQAYLAASMEMLRRSDHLLAVWDGRPSADVGDTADVVHAARRHHRPVTVLWPTGARRC